MRKTYIIGIGIGLLICGCQKQQPVDQANANSAEMEVALKLVAKHIVNADAKQLLPLLAKEEVKNHELTEPKLQALLDLFKARTRGMTAGEVIVIADPEIGSGRLALTSPEGRASLLSFTHYAKGSPTLGAYAITGIIFGINACSAGATTQTIASRLEIMNALKKGLNMDRATLTKLGYTKMTKSGFERKWLTLDEELSRLDKVIAAVKARNAGKKA